MTIQVKLEGRKRKELATAVGGILHAEVNYKGPPTYEFQVGKVTIGRDGTVSLETKRGKDTTITNRLLEGLSKQGFEPLLVSEADQTPDDPSNEAVKPADDREILPFDPEWPDPEWFHDACSEEIVPESPDNLVIQIPREGFDAASLQNLRLLVDSKAALIKKALGVTDLSIFENKVTVNFPWFEAGVPSEDLVAYTNFIAALCDMAKRQKRVIAVEKPTDNEKFTFRLFLVRLGLIGDEYADTRRILLRNLSGNGSWKDAEGKSTNPRSPRPDTDDSPELNGADQSETAYQKVLFIKRLGYFLLHFDE